MLGYRSLKHSLLGTGQSVTVTYWVWLRLGRNQKRVKLEGFVADCCVIFSLEIDGSEMKS